MAFSDITTNQFMTRFKVKQIHLLLDAYDSLMEAYSKRLHTSCLKKKKNLNS
jgi:hypothetical protein